MQSGDTLGINLFYIDNRLYLRDTAVMIPHLWRLSEGGEDNLGLACTNEGLVLGRTPLVEQQDQRFFVRERSEIERLLRRAYRTDLAVDRLMPGLAIVALALNANDRGLACIAAVHLRLPDLPDRTARDDMEAEDSLIRSSNRESAPPREIHKASPDDPKHPGWPAGTPGGLGGEFRPKDGAEAALTQQIKDRIKREKLRINLVAALHIGVEALANLIPGVDVAADVALVAEITRTFSEYRKLAIDAAAAFDFVKKGPHSLEELQVSSSDYEEFSNYDQFAKGELSPDQMAKRFGGAGDGNQYHHIVTQGGANGRNLSPQQLHNTDNILILPTLLHEVVSDEYYRPSGVPNMNMYQWLQTQPYEVQHKEGLRILRDLHILK
jgi:hypothetical protein